MLAVENDRLPVAAYLLERGVDVNKASLRLSPLHAAARLPVRTPVYACVYVCTRGRVRACLFPAFEFLTLNSSSPRVRYLSNQNQQDGRPLIRLLVRHNARLRAEQSTKSGRGNNGCYGWHSPLHEAAVRKRADNAQLLAELGADPCGRDGHGLTPLDYCGGGSAVGRAIRKGVVVKEVRDAVRRLFLVSVVVGHNNQEPLGPHAPVAASLSFSSSSPLLADCEDGPQQKRQRRRGKQESPLSWREARRQRGRPLPAVVFGDDNVKEGATKRAATLWKTAMLLRGVFLHMPVDVRRQIVKFV